MARGLWDWEWGGLSVVAVIPALGTKLTLLSHIKVDGYDRRIKVDGLYHPSSGMGGRDLNSKSLIAA